MNTTTTSPSRLRNASTMTALAAVVALFSTGCTQAEIDGFLAAWRAMRDRLSPAARASSVSNRIADDDRPW